MRRIFTFRKLVTIYALTILIASYITILWTLYSSSIFGLSTGRYEVLITTNSVGENWYEIALLIIGMPAILFLTFSSLLSQ